MSQTETPAERAAGMEQLRKAAAAQAIAEFNAAVDRRQETGRYATRKAAAVAVAKAHPQMHRDYLKACNPRAARRGLLDA